MNKHLRHAFLAVVLVLPASASMGQAIIALPVYLHAFFIVTAAISPALIPY